MVSYENVEFLFLGDFDPETNRRDFDAVSYGTFYWRGRLDFIEWERPKEGRIYVFSDRDDPLGDDYAMRPGKIEEVEQDELARRAIAKAIVQCFDHTTTIKAFSDGKGGWITLETDT